MSKIIEFFSYGFEIIEERNVCFLICIDGDKWFHKDYQVRKNGMEDTTLTFKYFK